MENESRDLIPENGPKQVNMPQKPKNHKRTIITSTHLKSEDGSITRGLSIDATFIPKEVKNEDAQSYVMKKIFGTENAAASLDVFKYAAGALPNYFNNPEDDDNSILAGLQEMKVNDIVEARLSACEMVLYATGMRYLSRAENERTIPQAEFYMKNAIKLLRLHNETVEALNKHRRGGEQRVVVQHVNVNDGGKAVVNGSFDGGGKENPGEVGHGHPSNL